MEWGDLTRSRARIEKKGVPPTLRASIKGSALPVGVIIYIRGADLRRKGSAMSVKANFSFELGEDQLSFRLGSPAIHPKKIGGANEDKAEAEVVEAGEENAVEEAKPSIRVSHRYGHRHLSRKAASEEALSRQLDWYFREGDCYHCFSFGDVDSLTFFKHVLRQQRVLYLALSTWCMAGEDVDDLREWHRRGMLGRVDFYVGESFPGSYSEVYNAALDFVKECGGRIAVFRNHSKVMVVIGERFDCLIESSANVNTNPRSENTVITVDRQLAADYVQLFNGIRSFDAATSEVEPYVIPERGWERDKAEMDETDHGELQGSRNVS